MKYAYTILYVENVTETIQFYENAFGFSRKFISPENDYGELISGETTISFASIALGNANFKSGFEQSTSAKKPFGIELAFATENIETDFQNAINAGATEFEPITEKPWGQKVGYLRDNNGFLIEVCTPIKSEQKNQLEVKMNAVFETFKPENPFIAKYVDYYYLDIKPHNVKTEFDCFPHINNTLSVYKSHICPQKGTAIFESNAPPLQIFTPTRESVFQVEQIGSVYRIVLVFKPLGIQQFYRGLDFTDFITNYLFFTHSELNQLFETQQTTRIASLLDQFLLDRFQVYDCSTLSHAISLILTNSDSSSIEQIATSLNVSRRHLNRLFNAHFGISVKRFNEIVLFRKTLEHKLFGNPDQNFTELAYAFNYYDQSHLNRSFRNFTSNSPKRFLKQGTLLGNEYLFWHLKK